MSPLYIYSKKETIKLTSREKEILQLTANELTCQEIAKTLFISLSTVETHRRNLLFKMDVKNVAGLIRKSFEMGFLAIHTESISVIQPNATMRLAYVG